MSCFRNRELKGVLLNPRSGHPDARRKPALVGGAVAEGTVRRPLSDKLAFTGLFLFMLLLYARPNDLFRDQLGDFPLVKIITVLAMVAYVNSRLGTHRPLAQASVELQCLLVIALLCIAMTPLALSPADGIRILKDHVLKIICVFILITNLVSLHSRLHKILLLVIACATIFSLHAMWSYLAGEFVGRTMRIEGAVGGMFEDPNDLAATFNQMIPLTVALALIYAGLRRRLLFFCAAAMVFGIVATFSRGGFLGLIAISCVLMWKLGRQYIGRVLFVALLATLLFIMFMPASYEERLFTLVDNEDGMEASAAERLILFQRGIYLMARHPILGLGPGNYSYYSFWDKKAHNGYLEISAELGVAGLIAYLTLMLHSFRELARIEARILQIRAAGGEWNPAVRNIYYLSVGLQGAIVGYMVCSFFLSLQYLWHIYNTVSYSVVLRALWAREAPAQVLAAPGDCQESLRPSHGVVWQEASRP